MATRTLVKTNQRSISLFGFPSVTVCAASRFSYSKVYGFLNSYILKNPILHSSVNVTKILKSFTLVDATQNDLDEMDIVLNENNITMQDVFYYTSQSCDELLQICKWEGKIRPCSELFKRVFGGGNFCCSFNYPVPDSVRYSNCILNCRIEKIIQACGCATYFFPSVNTSICPSSKLFCNIINQNLDIKTNKDGTIEAENCDCPDDCVVKKIHFIVQSTQFAHNNFTVDEFYDGVNEDNGIVHINFSKSFTRLMKRSLLFNEIQLASNVGGIVALFLGCSFISFFEIVYFLSIRLFVTYRRICIRNRLIKPPME